LNIISLLVNFKKGREVYPLVLTKVGKKGPSTTSFNLSYLEVK